MSGVREARAAEFGVVADLLCRFNAEFDDPAPEPVWLAERLGELAGHDVAVLVGGAGPDGLCVLRYRADLWTAAPECYLAELYVVPERRGRGLGRELLEASLAHARARGASRVELGTSEDDRAARALYESAGFSNRERPDGPVMYVYELEL